ncbi:outer dynein arm-docking complex subunit 1-like isoform X1 [Anguilla rostrata]|uniref:outer dynein arm-docking complex subunit 1-like isoform X1 n=1 Tax=Anguilla rostrata TaxID=7938 RepID=UPI0030CF902E
MPRGRSAVSILSDSSEMDIDGIAEAELAKLQRQFRIMEGDRQAYSIETQNLIRRQLQEIQKLQKEHEELQCSLRVSESHARRLRDTEATQTLRSTLERRDEVEEQLEREKQAIAQLDQEIFSLERKLADRRRGGSAVNLNRKAQASQTHQASHTLENKLHRALTSFNKQLAKIGSLREELETLHVERDRFQHLYRRLIKELQELRKDIGDVVDQSTSAYDARVEAQCKTVTLNEKAVKDLAQYNVEMQELERIIAHEHRLKTFMNIKNQERADEDAQDLSRKQATEEREKRKTESGEESIASLEEAFIRIQRITGEEDLDLLVMKFIEVEDRNFALFNYVNEQNNEAETLRDQISQIQQEMAQFRQEGQRQERERGALLREIGEQQEETEKQTQAYEQRATVLAKILDQLKTGVSDVFQEIGCDRSVIEDMLGSSSGIRDSDLITYLSLVEQKTNELLTIQSYLMSKDLEKDYDPEDVARVLLGQSPQLTRQNLSILPPSIGDTIDPEESSLTDEERPLTRNELQERVLKGIASTRIIVSTLCTNSCQSKLTILPGKWGGGGMTPQIERA